MIGVQRPPAFSWLSPDRKTISLGYSTRNYSTPFGKGWGIWTTFTKSPGGERIKAGSRRESKKVKMDATAKKRIAACAFDQFVAVKHVRAAMTAQSIRPPS